MDSIPSEQKKKNKCGQCGNFGHIRSNKKIHMSEKKDYFNSESRADPRSVFAFSAIESSSNKFSQTGTNQYSEDCYSNQKTRDADIVLQISRLDISSGKKPQKIKLRKKEIISIYKDDLFCTQESFWDGLESIEIRKKKGTQKNITKMLYIS